MSSELHPLDPLTSDEIRTCARVIREQRPNIKWIFNSMILIEPPKSILYPLLKQERPDFSNIARKALVVIIDKKNGRAYEVTIDLKDSVVENINPIDPKTQPRLTGEDAFLAERIVRADSTVQKRIKSYGLDIQQVYADLWSIGYQGEALDQKFKERRVVYVYLYFRNEKDDNQYAHPLDFAVYVDLIYEKVVLIENLPLTYDENSNKKNKFSKVLGNLCPDTSKPPQEKPDLQFDNSNYLNKFVGDESYRKDLTKLDIIQPDGPSFTVNGNEISWQKWKMRISFDYRVGLVLHYITYKHQGETREILYRAALSEMVVPYGDPRSPFYRKAAFDLGEYGLGSNANSLAYACDCLGFIKYFDVVLFTEDGEPSTIKNAICLHEEDFGTLQEHTQEMMGTRFVARSRRLVLSFIATVTNYEYAFYWYFYQDGTMALDVKATGEVSTHLLSKDGNTGGFGTIVFPQINAQYHQHLFCIRLDPIIDGLNNSVSVVDVKMLEDDVNTKGNGWTIEETKFMRSKEAVTDNKSRFGRFWRVYNPNRINENSNQPVGWALKPRGTTLLLANDSSKLRNRAGFATHSFWSTPYSDSEKYPSGEYVNQNVGGEGLEVWTNRNESIQNQDIVLWHTFGLNHVVRIEDFPIMPQEGGGFSFKPYHFFKENPALDVKPSCDNSKDTE